MTWQKRDSKKDDRKPEHHRKGKVTSNDESPPFDINGRMPPGKVVTEGRDNDGTKKNK
ncbi:TPA: hypothetical protein ACTY07_004362 [Citrobacter freundii]|uniref:hypothetical protein n=1 Tax=Hafnia paralvei TaxID=546367 RepID=UPI001B051696|nr:hypothetical protein [Hafnia paralvei]MBU2672638.1 hypothetical protein [Hafnia paralvei]HBA3651363.1 hypothetical protein [Escherichia coli]